MNEVLLLKWVESERGWGTRPDGCSLHLTEEDAKSFVKEYNEDLPDEVPEEYSRPEGELKKVQISEKLYTKLSESDNGIRLWQWDLKEEEEHKNILFK